MAATIISTAVLTGALIVGDSVKYSLLKNVSQRLGKTEFALSTNDRFVTSEIAGKIPDVAGVSTSAILTVNGIAINPDSNLRINNATLLGIDSTFWFVSGKTNLTIAGNEVLLSSNLANKLQLKEGHNILLRIHNKSAIPVNAPFNNNTDQSIALRVKVKGIVTRENLGSFSLQNDQKSPYNIFINIKKLQESINLPGKANIVIAAKNNKATTELLNTAMNTCFTLEDAGLTLKPLYSEGSYLLESSRIFIDNQVTSAINKSIQNTRKVITYLANSIENNELSTPYSFISALSGDNIHDNDIIINQWLANDIDSKIGDTIKIKYYVIGSLNKLREDSSNFIVSSIIPMDNPLCDSTYMPDFPGLHNAGSCSDWDAGVPVDMKKIRKKDEQYWDDFKGTPKAFISHEKGLELWSNDFGTYTSVRYHNIKNADSLRQEILKTFIPESLNLRFYNIRESGETAAKNGVDFSSLFVSLSFFLILSAVILMVLIYSLNIRQRLQETGVLSALGIPGNQIKYMLITESIPVILFAVIAGSFAGVFYNSIIIDALNSIWNQAVYSDTLVTHIKLSTVVIGGIISFTISFISVYLTLKKQLKYTLQSSIKRIQKTNNKTYKRLLLIAIICMLFSIIMIGYSIFSSLSENASLVLTAAFFLLSGLISIIALTIIRKENSKPGLKSFSLVKLTLKNLSRNANRSIAVIILLAIGTFTVIVTGSNRSTFITTVDNSSGTGGYDIWVETTVPVTHDLNTDDGLSFYGLESLNNNQFLQLTSLKGDDASCLNLNQVEKPSILGINTDQLTQRESFSITKLIIENDNPWDILKYNFGDNIIPAFVDQTVLTWGLMKSVGDTILYFNESGRPLKIIIAGGIQNSVFQGNILINDSVFRKNFPDAGGTYCMLVDASDSDIEKTERLLNNALTDMGIEIMRTDQRLRLFYSVTNTYLTIFMILGVLGILIGTIGLGIVLIRNIIDRKYEISLMMAVGIRKRQIRNSVMLENTILLILGIFVGLISAFTGIIPSVFTEAFTVHYEMIFAILGIIFLNGITWILLASLISMPKRISEILKSDILW